MRRSCSRLPMPLPVLVDDQDFIVDWFAADLFNGFGDLSRATGTQWRDFGVGDYSPAVTAAAGIGRSQVGFFNPLKFASDRSEIHEEIPCRQAHGSTLL